ncbi:unnamed protein product [Lepidochelys kempii]
MEQQLSNKLPTVTRFLMSSKAKSLMGKERERSQPLFCSMFLAWQLLCEEEIEALKLTCHPARWRLFCGSTRRLQSEAGPILPGTGQPHQEEWSPTMFNC